MEDPNKPKFESEKNKGKLDASEGSQEEEIKCANNRRALVLNIRRRSLTVTDEFCREEEKTPNLDQQKNRIPLAAAQLKSCSGVKLETLPRFEKENDAEVISGDEKATCSSISSVLVPTNWVTGRRGRKSLKSCLLPDIKEAKSETCLSMYPLSLDEKEVIDALMLLHASGHLLDKRSQMICIDAGEQVSGSSDLQRKRCQTEYLNSGNTVLRLEGSKLIERCPKEDYNTENTMVRLKKSKIVGEKWLKVSDVYEEDVSMNNDIKCNQKSASTTSEKLYGCPTNSRMALYSENIRKGLRVTHYDQIPASTKLWPCIDCKKSFPSSTALGGHRSSCKVKKSLHTLKVEECSKRANKSSEEGQVTSAGQGLGNSQFGAATSSSSSASPRKVINKEMSPTSPLDAVDDEVTKYHNGMHLDLNKSPTPE